MQRCSSVAEASGRRRCGCGRGARRRRGRRAARADRGQPAPRRSRPSSRGRASPIAELPRRRRLARDAFRRPCAGRSPWTRGRSALLVPVSCGRPGTRKRRAAARTTSRSSPLEKAAARLAAAQVGLVLRAFGAGNGYRMSSVSADGDAGARRVMRSRPGSTGAAERRRDRSASRRGRPGPRPRSCGLPATAAAGVLCDRGLDAGAGSRSAAPEASSRTNASRSGWRPSPTARGRTIATLGARPACRSGCSSSSSPQRVSPSQRSSSCSGRSRSGPRRRFTPASAPARRRSSSSTRALLTVVGQAIAELSLAHTLEDGGRTRLGAARRRARRGVPARRKPAAGREPAASSSGGEHAVAERLLELAFGPAARPGHAARQDARADLRLAPVRDAVIEAGNRSGRSRCRSSRRGVVGLLVGYLPRGRELVRRTRRRCSWRSPPVAVAAQNAQLHERMERLAPSGRRRSRRSARRRSSLRALYEISRSFAQSLSLDATLDAVTSAAVELLEADAAVIRMEDERGDQLVPRSASVADPRLASAVRPLLERARRSSSLPGPPPLPDGQAARPRSAERAAARRVVRAARAVPRAGRDGRRRPDRDAGRAARHAHGRLARPRAPHRRGRRSRPRSSSPGRPRSRSTTRASTSSRRTSRTRCSARSSRAGSRRSRASRSAPSTSRRRGSRSAATSTTSSRCRTGGSRSCSATRAGTASPRRRTWRSRSSSSARSSALYPDPGDLLAQANEVALGELAGGTFMTMVCLTVDPATATSAPRARATRRRGSSRRTATVVALAPTAGSRSASRPTSTTRRGRDDSARAPRSASTRTGSSRRARTASSTATSGSTLALAAGRELSAQELAEHVVADARGFAGEPEDDYAVVVIRRRSDGRGARGRGAGSADRGGAGPRAGAQRPRLRRRRRRAGDGDRAPPGCSRPTTEARRSSGRT